MIEYSIWEKISAVYELMFESPLFLILLLGVCLMLIDALYISRTSKKTKISYIIISLAVIGVLMYSYIESVGEIVDAASKNIITLIYFPTVFEYMLVLLLSLIILIFSFFSKKMKNIIKRINLFVFVINMFLFFLIVDQIYTNDVDLTSQIGIYSNSHLMMLLELSLIVFIIWIIGLTLYKIINILINKNTIQNEEVNLDTTPNFYQEPILPPNLNELRMQALMAPPQIEYVYVDKETDEDLNKLKIEALMAEPRIEYIYVEKDKEDEMFTLEEYRQMRALLEVIKKKKAQKKQKK